MEAFQVFASNLSDSLFWPFVGLTVVAVIVGVVSWIIRDDPAGGPAYLSEAYGNATWRMHTAAQGVVIMWLAWALVNAVPEPNYIYQTKTVEVVKRINTATNFNEAYSECMEPRQHNNIDNEDDSATCDIIAKELVLGKQNVKIVPKVKYVRAVDTYVRAYKTCMDGRHDSGMSMAEDNAVCEPLAKELALGKPAVKVVVKEVIKKVPIARELRYRALYNTCMGKDLSDGGWSADDGKQRQERIQLCHRQATEVIHG